MLAVFSSTLFAATFRVEVLVAAGGVVLAAMVAGGIALWRLVGAGPRRQRAYLRARTSLAQGDWQATRDAVDEIKLLGVPTPEWQGRINNLEGECLRLAGEKAMRESKFEEALEHHVAAAKMLSTNPAAARERIIEAMLTELRARAVGNPDEKLLKLAQRIIQLSPQQAEAHFWLGLAYLKLNRTEPAQAALRCAVEIEKKSVEPALYLGMLLLREGKAKDGLRFLAEANRTAPHALLVSWQLGMGLVVSGGDSSLAVRALQKVVAPDGLPKLAKNPERFWADALPEGSFIGKLGGKQPFVCPILGSTFPGMVRQAKLALGQALFRLERTLESVAVLQELLNESEPTVPLLRALGIALCKLERYDDAYPQLRAAYEQDNAKSPWTACNLAWCATKAKPSKPEDRPANVRWAVRLLADVPIPAEIEPTRLVCQVYAEARTLGIPVGNEDLLRLCGTIVTLNLCEPLAAHAIDLLAETVPHAVRPQHAFLYGWSTRLHGVRGTNDITLLMTVVQQELTAQDYFAQRGWKFDEVERLFLERWVENHTGFPEALGSNYPAKCEKALLEQAKKQEDAGDVHGARATIDLLRRLTPPTAATFDRTARLAYARGDIDEALRVLSDWSTQFPAESTPLLRLAVIEQKRGRSASSRTYVERALATVPPLDRAAVALLGARLAMQAQEWPVALAYTTLCLNAAPENTDALWLTAALNWRLGKLDALAALAPRFERAHVTEPRFHVLGAVCFLLAADFDAARIALRRLANEAAWQVDGHHLMGVLHWRRNDWPGAASRLEAVVQDTDHVAREHARALLGRVRWEQGATVDAVQLWAQVPLDTRKSWGLEAILPTASFLAGIDALRTSNPSMAAEWLGRARELGFHDRWLPMLHERALVHAARESLASAAGTNDSALVPLLERASKSRGPQQALAALLLARLHRGQGRVNDAREALRRVSPPTTPVLLEMAAVALVDKQLVQAEELLNRALPADPHNFAARFNLLWIRFSLGNTRGASELTPALIETAPTAEQKRLLTHLHTLLQGGSTLNIAFADMSADEERVLLESLFRVGKLETVVPYLCQFAAARAQSREAKEAQTLGMLRLGKQSFDRGNWLAAEKWLSPLAKARPSAAVRNLLGLAACLTQDFSGGILHLQEAQRLAGDDPRLHQNLALAFTLQGDFDEAGLCWGRYLGMMDKRLPRPPGFIDYHEQLRFQVLRFLGNQQYDREKWPESLAFLNEAHGLRPDLADLAERVFLLQIQVGQRDDARRMLNHLHQLKPKHGPYQLYELDLVDVRASADLEKLLDALSRVVEQMLDDPTVQDKAVQRIAPTLQYRSDYLTRIMREIREDLRRLYEDSPGWYDALRDLRSVKRDLRRLRQVVRYCGQLQVAESTRRRLETLTDELDRKIEYCRRWEEDDR